MCFHLQLGSNAKRLAIPNPLRVLVLLLLVSACESPIQVSVDVDPDADFSALETYAWISPDPLIPRVSGVTDGPPISPIDDKRIRRAVDAQLSARGWKEVELPDDADLVVSYGIGARDKTEIYDAPGMIGFDPYWYGYGGWYAGSTLRTKQYTEGTITLEFFDRATRQVWWVGWASKRISQSDDRQDVIETAVEKILRDFPSRR